MIVVMSQQRQTLSSVPGISNFIAMVNRVTMHGLKKVSQIRGLFLNMKLTARVAKACWKVTA
jgi:hypothetical protein